MIQAVDAVITWVNGDDPKLKAKQEQYFKVDEADGRTSTERFSDCNEIYYCISSILKNAPFINRIFIVTDDQIPPAIAQIEQVFGETTAERIQVVSHRDIFAGYEEYLPTFNSVSIETVLHRIPGLSDRYIYLNDDFIIAKPVQEDEFFEGDRPILRGKWLKENTVAFSTSQRQRMQEGRPYIKAKLFSYKECQFNAYKVLGIRDEFFWHDHTPHPFSRPDIEEFLRDNDSVLRSNIRFRTRDSSQYDPMSLANGINVQKGAQQINKTQLTYLKPSDKTFQRFYVWRKRKSFEAHSNKFLCVQSLSQSKPATQQIIFDWLEELIFGQAQQ